MNLDLLSMGAISISAYVVVVTTAHILGGNLRSRIWIGVLLGLWFIGVCAVGASQVIVGGGPLRTGGLGALVIVPVAVLSALVFLLKDLRERIRQVPMLPLIAVQILRTLGVIFVLLYEAHRLPAPFALFAGYGDMLVGLLAIPLTWIIASGKPYPRIAIYLWSALGIGDLINALAMGTLSAPSPFQVFHNGPSSAIMPMLPWVLIPGFMVPLFLVLHFIVLAKMQDKTTASSQVGDPTLLDKR
jgi:hypothetical protein